MIGVVGQKIFKWDVVTQRKSFNTVQTVFSGMAKQVILKLERTTEENHFLVGLDEKKMVTRKAEAKKTLEKRASKRTLRRWHRGKRRVPPSEFNDVFSVNYVIPSTRSCRIKRVESYKGLGITTVLIAIMQRSTSAREGGQWRKGLQTGVMLRDISLN